MTATDDYPTERTYMTILNSAVSMAAYRGWIGRGQSMVYGLAITVALLLATTTTTALAAPAWKIKATANTTAPAGGELRYHVAVGNTGDALTSGPVELRVELPEGITASNAFQEDGFLYPFDCSDLDPGDTQFTCVIDTPIDPTHGSAASLTVATDVALDATGVLTASFELSGGGAQTSATTVEPTEISDVEPGLGFDVFDGRLTASPAGDPFLQAGGHPYSVDTQFLLNTVTHPINGDVWPPVSIKDLTVDLPPGLVGSPTAVEQCTMAELTTLVNGGVGGVCPTGSQVGIVEVRTDGTSRLDEGGVYSMVPPPSVPARFAFIAAGTVVTLDAALRTGGDYGLSVSSLNTSQAVALVGSEVSFWGFPADPAHDAQRHCPVTNSYGCSTEAPVRPFLRLPTSCTAPGVGLETKLRMDSWEHPGEFVSSSFTSHLPPGFPRHSSEWGPVQGPTGCEDVPFDPELSAQPSVPARANEPSGFSFDLSVPQTDESIGQGDLRKAVVTLPEGVRVSPPSAAGLEGCSPAQIGLASKALPSCPDGSKLGTLEVDTPLLDEPLTGDVYLAKPFDNPSNTLLGLYLVAEGLGVVVKLDGRVDADPVTGRLTATFDENPQLPFSNLHLEFDDGPRAALVLPSECGTHTTRAVLTSWSGKTVVSESSFEVTRDSAGQPCAARFDPGFEAGSVNPVAGVFSPFVARILRSDRDQELGRIDMTLPQGAVADLSDVDLCTQAQIDRAAARSGKAAQMVSGCPAGSQIGTITVGAGAGPNSFYPTLPGSDRSGRVFLTEAYTQTKYRLAGIPQPAYGLAIEVPAVAGPFDLGNVLVRAAVYVDPETAQLKVLSDPLPRILDGIPLQVRDVQVDIDRERFTVTPTSCDEMAVTAGLHSTAGRTAVKRSRFQVGDCSRLRLTPRLSMRLTGRGQMRSKGHPALRTKLTQPAGQANISRVKVVLPRSIVLDPTNANNTGLLCGYEEALAADCPASSVIGNATAISPLLKRPLRGRVYFAQGKRRDPRTNNLIRTFPTLLVTLRGEVALNLRAKTNVTPKGLVTTFPIVPDARVSSFALNLRGGKKRGILLVTANAQGNINLCNHTQRARLAYRAHNNRQTRQTIGIKTACTKAKRTKHRQR
jgi:hypothetical protein